MKKRFALHHLFALPTAETPICILRHSHSTRLLSLHFSHRCCRLIVIGVVWMNPINSIHWKILNSFFNNFSFLLRFSSFECILRFHLLPRLSLHRHQLLRSIAILSLANILNYFFLFFLMCASWVCMHFNAIQIHFLSFFNPHFHIHTSIYTHPICRLILKWNPMRLAKTFFVLILCKNMLEEEFLWICILNNTGELTIHPFFRL